MNNLDTNIQKQIKSLGPLISGFDKISDHVIITNPQGLILYANAAVERFTGFSRSEVIGKNPSQLWGGLMPKEFYQQMWDVIKNKKRFFVGEVQNMRKDKTKYWQRIHITPILDKKGEVEFFLGIEPDITKHKEQEGFEEEFSSIAAQPSPPENKFKEFSSWLSGHPID